jgi:hypothetical protein
VILLGGEREPALDEARWRGAGPELAALGLDTPAGLAARWIRGPRPSGSLPTAHPLTDDEPWVIYLPRRGGAVLLGDLPQNLAWLRTSATELPGGWRSHGERLDGLRALHRAREIFSIEEARLRGLSLELPLAATGALPSGDPELLAFAEEREFLDVLRRGVSALGNDPAGALPDLVRAAELRRERGDVHLYLAVALEKTGSAAAAQALAAAIQRCPAIARTREGMRARQLGLSDSAWSALERSADEHAKQELR